MCLIKDPNHYQVKTAVRPMLTYKVVQHNGLQFRTPFLLKEVTVNEVTVAYPEKPLYEKNKKLSNGFIHSFSSIQAARKLQRFLNALSLHNHVIVESYIPAGTNYYFNSENKEIAAKKLLITDVIVK